jgi:hypothetical protein
MPVSLTTKGTHNRLHTLQYIHYTTYTTLHTLQYIHYTTYTTLHTLQYIHYTTYTTVHTVHYARHPIPQSHLHHKPRAQFSLKLSTKSAVVNMALKGPQLSPLGWSDSLLPANSEHGPLAHVSIYYLVGATARKVQNRWLQFFSLSQQTLSSTEHPGYLAAVSHNLSGTFCTFWLALQI